MLRKVYSLRDSKAQIYNEPFMQHTHGEAERTIRASLKKPDHLIAQYPEDYDLYYLGDYDDNSGTFKVLDTPQHIVKVVQLTQSPS